MLPDEDKTREQLISELAVLRQRVTELEALESERKRTVEELENIFNLSPDMVGVFTAEGELIKVNPAWETILGYKTEELLEMGWTTLVHPDDVEGTNKEVEKQLKGSSVVNFVNRYKCKDGSYKTLEWQATFATEGIVHATARDITERKQAEEELKVKAQLLDAATDAILVNDFEGNIVYVNEAAYRSLGYSKDELMGKNIHAILTPEYAPLIEQRLENLVKRGEVTFESARLRKDESEIPLEIHARIIESGDRTLVFTIARDITERKQAEKELRESEVKYRGLVTNVKLGVFRSTQGRAGKFLEANPAMVEITGYSRKELLQMNVSDLYAHPEKREATLEEIATRRGKATRELHLRKKDGTEIVVSDTKVAVRDDAGKIIYFDGIIEDITERKQAEKALRESGQFSSNLLTNASNPIIVVNPDTSIRYVNPALEKLTGCSAAEVVGRKAPFPWWTEETLRQASGDSEEFIRSKSERREMSFQRKNGERFWVELTSRPITHNGEVEYYLISWVDITERKQAEEREKQLQEELNLASRLASIGELAAGVAHEINNPLTGILGFTELLLRKSADGQARQNLERIHNETLRVAAIVENLLTFARQHKPVKQYSNINDILQKSLELRAYELQTGDIAIVTDLAPSLPEIMVDFYQIQEVFLNIILNAEQAMIEAHDRGKLSIKTQEIKGYIRISFTDDGPGIPAKQLGKVFNPFFTTRGETGGTGLGLSVSHGIVAEHGGKIYAKSKPGKGAIFFVELPVTTEKIDEGTVVEKQPAAGKNMC